MEVVKPESCIDNRSAQRRALPGYVPQRIPIPEHPYLPEYIGTAEQNGELPPPRDANGEQAPAQPVPAAQEVDAVPAPRPSVNNFYFEFQPPLPWDEEPNITLPPIQDLLHPHPDVASGARDDLLDVPTTIWDDDATDANWMGSAFLGAGGYGSAALWCKVNRNGNIDKVRFRESRQASQLTLLTIENGHQRLCDASSYMEFTGVVARPLSA